MPEIILPERRWRSEKRGELVGVVGRAGPRALSFFSDGGLDCDGDHRDQGGFCSRAEIQSSAHLVSEHFFSRFYRLSGAGDGGLHVPAFIHKQTSRARWPCNDEH